MATNLGINEAGGACLNITTLGTIMFSSAALLATVTLALSLAATPVVVRDNIVSLPLAKRFNATSALRILEHDQRRAAGLKQFAHAKRARREGRSVDAGVVTSVPSVNEVVNYAVDVGFPYVKAYCTRSCVFHQVAVGTPPTTCKHPSWDAGTAAHGSAQSPSCSTVAARIHG